MATFWLKIGVETHRHLIFIFYRALKKAPRPSGFVAKNTDFSGLNLYSAQKPVFSHFSGRFLAFFSTSTHPGRSYPITADKRQPKIVTRRFRLSAVKVNGVCAHFRQIGETPLEKSANVFAPTEPKISSTSFRFFILTA